MKMENQMSFEIILNSLLLDPLKSYFSRHTEFKYVQQGPSVFKLICNDFTFEKLYNLGYAAFYYTYIWNKKITDRIKERSSVDFLGRRIFKGTEEEKKRLNQLDEERLISFPSGFFENLLSDTRSINNEHMIRSPIHKKILFEVMLDSADSIQTPVEECNEKYATNFKIIDIHLDDQLYFAKIESLKTNLMGIFSLGYLVSYLYYRK